MYSDGMQPRGSQDATYLHRRHPRCCPELLAHLQGCTWLTSRAILAARTAAPSLEMQPSALTDGAPRVPLAHGCASCRLRRRLACSTAPRQPTPDARVLQRAMSHLLHRTTTKASGKGMADMAEDLEDEPDLDESHLEARAPCAAAIPA